MRFSGQVAVERHQRRAAEVLGGQQAFDRADFAFAGEESQDPAFGFVQRAGDDVGDGGFDAGVRRRRDVARFDRVEAAFAAHDGAVHEFCDALAVERRRHHKDFQLVVQRGLDFERECEA